VVVFILSWALMPHPRAWRPFILVASYVFYGWIDWRWVLLLVGSTLVNTVAAQVIARSPSQATRKRALIAAIAFDLGLLCVFKYLSFFVSQVDDSLDSIGLGSTVPLLQIVLPIGISFFTFQAISYVVDVYRGETRAAPLGDVAILQAFFPHLIAGPIVRANELLPQLRTPRDPREVLAGPGLFLIVGGVIKKTVVADELARNVVDPVFNDPSSHSGLETLLAIYGFAAQIYCDFSGYTDMAIGLALLLGFQLPQNFNRPYLALSLQDFWRRWHMTLSRWLRDYLYIPLGGNRKGRAKTYRNLMLTMLLGGLWHGAAWTFVIWGALHGVYLCINHAWSHFGPKPSPRFARLADIAGVILTFSAVVIAWVFFRAPDMATALSVLSKMADPGNVALGRVEMLYALFVAIYAALAWFAPNTQEIMGYDHKNRIVGENLRVQRMRPLFLYATAAVLAFGILGIQQHSEFIYFRF
jgi:D-alanyl-lipoteichoic acid acyltransferase DltB (MBOAT superfamily)